MRPDAQRRHFDVQLPVPSDWVDRASSPRDGCILFALKCQYPARVFLVRGNHEDPGINRYMGFSTSASGGWAHGTGKYSPPRVPTASGTWPAAPQLTCRACRSCVQRDERNVSVAVSAAVVERCILCVHGGRVNQVVATLESLAAVRWCRSSWKHRIRVAPRSPMFCKCALGARLFHLLRGAWRLASAWTRACRCLALAQLLLGCLEQLVNPDTTARCYSMEQTGAFVVVEQWKRRRCLSARRMWPVTRNRRARQKVTALRPRLCVLSVHSHRPAMPATDSAIAPASEAIREWEHSSDEEDEAGMIANHVGIGSTQERDMRSMRGLCAAFSEGSLQNCLLQPSTVYGPIPDGVTAVLLSASGSHLGIASK